MSCQSRSRSRLCFQATCRVVRNDQKPNEPLRRLGHAQSRRRSGFCKFGCGGLKKMAERENIGELACTIKIDLGPWPHQDIEVRHRVVPWSRDRRTAFDILQGTRYRGDMLPTCSPVMLGVARKEFPYRREHCDEIKRRYHRDDPHSEGCLRSLSHPLWPRSRNPWAPLGGSRATGEHSQASASWN